MYKFSCYTELCDLRTFMFCCEHLCYDMKCEEGESFLHVLWPLYQTLWRIEELYFKVALISPLQHTGFQYPHILAHLYHCHCGRQKRVGTEFSSTICSKRNFFPLNSPSTLVENKLIINLKFLFASWTLYSICLYFCFLKSIPSLITIVW